MVDASLPRQVARLGQPPHGLRHVAGGELEQPDVLLRERLAANVLERGEVLDALRVEVARSVELAAEEGEVPEVRERGRDRLRRVGRAGGLEGGFEAGAGRVEVALLAGEDPDAVQGPGPQAGGLLRARLERQHQRAAALGEVTANRPEPAQGDGEPERRQSVTRVEREGECGAKVVVLVLEPREPDDLVGREPLRSPMRFT